MTEKEQPAFEQLTTTLSYLDSHHDIWESVPIVQTYRDHLADSIHSLNEELTEQPDKPDFGSGTLHQLRISIAEKMDILDDILEAYAEDKEDNNLLDVAKNSKTDYLRLTNDGFERKVVNVMKLLEEYQDPLRNYGLHQDQIDEVNTEFEDFKAKRNHPQPSQQTPTDNPQIQLLMEEASHTCDRLRKVMVSFRTSNSTFYNGFMSIETVNPENS